MSFRSSSSVSAIALALCLLPACTQVRGRKRIREANELYHRGKYAEAVTLYKEAEPLVPNLPALWLNEGYTCRQLIAPGGGDPESQRAAACALGAFRRLGEVAPKDPRAAELTLQTWFDMQDYPSLEAAFLERRRKAPDDLDAVHGLQDVYFKWGKWSQALDWSKQAAALRSDDAEAQYGVGTFVWQILSTHGGGTPMAGYSPWPELAGATRLDDRRAPASRHRRHHRRGARRAGRPGDPLSRKGDRPAPSLSGGDDLSGAPLAAKVLRVLRRSDRLAGRRRRGRQLAAARHSVQGDPQKGPRSPAKDSAKQSLAPSTRTLEICDRWRSRPSAGNLGHARRADGSRSRCRSPFTARCWRRGSPIRSGTSTS